MFDKKLRCYFGCPNDFGVSQKKLIWHLLKEHADLLRDWGLSFDYLK